MSEHQPPRDNFGNPVTAPDHAGGLNFRPAYDKPGPPPEEGAEEGHARLDSRDQLWVRAQGRWVAAFAERMVYVVVSAPGAFEVPRAWAFDDEQAAVAFRCEHIESSHRRAGSLSPIFAVPVNNTAHAGYQEIDWKKHPAPAAPVKGKKFM